MTSIKRLSSRTAVRIHSRPAGSIRGPAGKVAQGNAPVPPRAAVYVRYSSTDRSGAKAGIERQLKAAAGHAAATGSRCVATFVDVTQSGASPHDRAGLRRLLAEANHAIRAAGREVPRALASTRAHGLIMRVNVSYPADVVAAASGATSPSERTFE